MKPKAPAKVPPKVSIVVLNWNGKKFLHDFFTSCKKQDQTNFEVICVDNGSSDGSQTYIKKIFPWVILIELEKNVGFASGCNIGFKFAKAEYVAFLNNDMILDKNWVRILSASLDKYSDCAAVGSLMINKDNYDEHKASFENEWKNKTMGTYTLVGNHATCRIIGEERDTKNIKLREVFYIGGGSIMFRKSLVKNPALPFFDDYFGYAEDVSLSIRLRYQKKKLFLCYSTSVLHVGNSTFSRMKPLQAFHGAKNRIMNYLLFFNLWNIIRIFPMMVVNQVSYMLMQPRVAWPILKGYFWIILNLPMLMRRKKLLSKSRKVSDKEIIQIMSCKMIDDGVYKNPFLLLLQKMLNATFCSYARLVRLHTIEFRK